MATNYQLRARIEASHAEHIDEISEDRDITETEAERVVFREGLESMGYVERPTAPHELFLWYVRRIGLVLGLVGLISIGYGIFGSRLFSLIGFGLTLIGFLLVAVADALETLTERHDASRS